MQEKYSKENFAKLIERLRGEKGADLSMAEDLSIAVMNLISLEEHFFFTAEKTGKDSYFDSAEEVRKVRKDALHLLVGEHEGETWCATKHLLASTMRLIEVGVKLQADSRKDEAKKVFDNAYKIYSVFWALRLRLISVKEMKKAIEDDSSTTIENLTTKLANCCDE